jgi:transposase InsO family protein
VPTIWRILRAEGASTLTDNGMVYTTRFARGGSGPNGFEQLLNRLGITQKNGSPGHPQTQGMIGFEPATP